MLVSLFFLLSLATPLLATPQSITIYADAVHSTSKPAPLVKLSYDALTLSAEVESYTPPKSDLAADSLVRVGFYDASTSDWHGVVTSATSFAHQFQKRITVYVDDRGDVYHIGFSASGRSGKEEVKNSKKTKKEDKKTRGVENDEVVVEVVGRKAGPQPHFNKPVVLNADGKVEQKEPEKSFLQKYWWAIAIFLLVQVVAGGGGGESK